MEIFQSSITKTNHNLFRPGLCSGLEFPFFTCVKDCRLIWLAITRDHLSPDLVPKPYRLGGKDGSEEENGADLCPFLFLQRAARREVGVQGEICRKSLPSSWAYIFCRSQSFSGHWVRAVRLGYVTEIIWPWKHGRKELSKSFSFPKISHVVRNPLSEDSDVFYRF